MFWKVGTGRVGWGGKSREDGCGAWASPSGLILPREGQRRRRSLPWKWRTLIPLLNLVQKKRGRTQSRPVSCPFPKPWGDCLGRQLA